MTTKSVSLTPKIINSDTYNQKNRSFVRPHLKVEFENFKLKFLVLGLIILFNGLTAIISHVYLAQILKLSGFDIVNPPTPSLMAFLLKFFGDSSIYIIILILLGMGSFANELEINKQVYFTLSRPVSRRSYYFSRTLLQVIGISLTIAVTSFIIYIYSLVYFDPLPLDKILLSLFVLSLQYASFYAIMIMYSSKFSQSMAGVLGFVTYIFMAIIGVFDPLKWFSPLSLSSVWTKIVTNSLSLSDFLTTTTVLFAWVLFPVMIGWIVYKRRDI